MRDWSVIVSMARRQICAALAGLTLVGLVACQSDRQQSSTPGALPRTPTGLTPRLNASTYTAHGQLLERRGDLERAAWQYRQALELVPDLSAARNRLGITLNKLGRHGEASSEFRRALLKHPHEAYLHNNLGFSLYLEEEYEAAEPELARALELWPSFRRARMNHALVLAKLGQYDHALEEFCWAGSEADAYYNIGVLLAEAGRYADAARSLDQALHRDPNLSEARDHLRQISHLAAAEEAARLAAAEAAAAPAETARGVTADMEDRASEIVPVADLQLLTDGEPGTLTSASPNAATSARRAERAARIYDHIQDLLAAAEKSMALWAPKPGETCQLMVMFDELMSALAANDPRCDICLSRFEEFLGLTPEWN
ncbi:MAG: tetratricopeptide repeat protein [Phycisphaerae bacterium]|nr:tetratricopeptide repeat protein [Phycisphaerae bacterium]